MMTKKELFLKLANPDDNFNSRWVYKTEFVGEYKLLNFNNGCPWIRNFGFFYETKTENKIWSVRIKGKKEFITERPISESIRKFICSLPSSHSGLNGTSNDYIIPDHKNGRYNDLNVLNLETQSLEDFQPLTLRENLHKRQSCKMCKKTNKRFDAKILGYSISFTEGDEFFDDKIKCNGCYWFDCIKFKQSLNYGIK